MLTSPRLAETSAETGQSPLEVAALDGVAGEGDGSAERVGGLVVTSGPAERLGSRGVEQVVGRQVDLVEGVECGRRAAVLHHGDRPVERDNGVWAQALQVVVERDDLGPVGGGRRRRIGVDGGDGGLDLIGTRAVAIETGSYGFVALRGELAGPPGPGPVPGADERPAPPEPGPRPGPAPHPPRQ